MTEEKKQKLATRIMAEIQPEIDKLIEERDAARTQVEWAKQRLSHLLAVAGDDGSLNADRKIKDLADTCYEAAHAMPQSEAIRFIVALFTSRKDGGDDIFSAEPAQDGGKSDGVELIRRERERQKTVEGWTPEHDDQHARGELASAAVCYAMIPDPESAVGVEVPADWPESWSESWWKPSPNNRVRELSKAGALIAAEIDRLMRAAEVKRRTEEGSRG